MPNVLIVCAMGTQSKSIGNTIAGNVLVCIGPILGTMFWSGFMLGLIAPESMGWLAKWLLLGPILLIGAGLVMTLLSGVFGRLLR